MERTISFRGPAHLAARLGNQEEDSAAAPIPDRPSGTRQSSLIEYYEMIEIELWKCMTASIIQHCTMTVHMMQKEGIIDGHCHLCHFWKVNRRPIN